MHFPIIIEWNHLYNRPHVNPKHISYYTHQYLHLLTNSPAKTLPVVKLVIKTGEDGPREVAVPIHNSFPEEPLEGSWWKTFCTATLHSNISTFLKMLDKVWLLQQVRKYIHTNIVTTAVPRFNTWLVRTREMHCRGSRTILRECGVKPRVTLII